MGQVAICCRLSGHTWRCLLITLVLLATEGHEAYLIHRNSESLNYRKLRGNRKSRGPTSPALSVAYYYGVAFDLYFRGKLPVVKVHQ